MSQQQPERPQEPINYGDIFSGKGELAEKAVAPKDVAMMQKAENSVIGQTQKGGVDASMQSPTSKNESSGLVGRERVSADSGVYIKETESPRKRVISEYFGKEIVGRYSQRDSFASDTDSTSEHCGGITIGEALEATALTAGKKPVEWSDAAAIQAAEVRATGRTSIMPGGVAAAAQSAATLNARATRDEDKTKLGAILANATAKLPADKPATRKDAEGVMGAEMRNDPNLTTHPAGVAASVAAAARLNQSHK
ncbi:late embryogenesis abundant protein 47-like [Gossypium australe]|uniref:Late embryogenesis abundant protein 47-like n=1 Tax=Gossypium australe TaxID=47621 RepID=A0A5B6VTE4_9ROSI|nr:late embryogenesis abundant protein 47-like [Gossypium australe]